jgi:hypothetical protein
MKTTAKRNQLITNIFGNMNECWQWGNPTGVLLEKIVVRSAEIMYPKTEHLGAGTTIVDVKIGKLALDVKGSKGIGFLKRKPTNNKTLANYNIFPYEHNGKQLWVKVPRYTVTQIRRPSVELKNWEGNAKEILTEQIQEYESFAHRTTTEAGCSKLFSLVVLYGEYDGLVAGYASIKPFTVEYPTKFETNGKKYNGFDDDGNETFSISAMNAGSINTYKRFDTQNGILKIWKKKDSPNVNYDPSVFGKNTVSVTI